MHPLALEVDTEARLHALAGKRAAWPGVTVEFRPELLGGGSTQTHDAADVYIMGIDTHPGSSVRTNIDIDDALIAQATKLTPAASRTEGITIRNTIDLIIGAFGIVHRHTLLHDARDFGFTETHLGLKTA